MKLRALTRAVLVIMSVTLVASCSRERIDWKSAEAADTPEAYNHFLERHPDSALATQAHARLAQLAEDKDWQRASAADTADAYKQFLAQHPSGKWTEEARIRMENFSLDSNPSPTSVAADASASPASQRAPTNAANASERAQPGESASAPPSVAAQHVSPPTARVASDSPSRAAPPPGPPSKPAPVAPPSSVAHTASTAANNASKPSSAPKPAASASLPKQTMTTGPASKPVTTASTDNLGGYGIQLGAFSSQAAALNEWKRLQIAHEAELHGLFAHAVPIDVTSGKLYRLQSPVGDEARARSICASLTKKQTPCVVVLPPEKR
jgi:cell division septation protein DedD